MARGAISSKVDVLAVARSTVNDSTEIGKFMSAILL